MAEGVAVVRLVVGVLVGLGALAFLVGAYVLAGREWAELERQHRRLKKLTDEATAEMRREGRLP